MRDEIVVSIDGPGRTTADFGEFRIATDHPPDEELSDRDPTPWSMFLASIGTCAASFVAGAAREEGIDTEGIRIIMRHEFRGESGCGLDISIEIEAPDDVRESLVVAANRCTVKCAIEEGTRISIA